MRGHIRPRGKGKWMIGFDIGRDPVTGKRRQRWHTVTGSKKDAERELRDMIRTLETGSYVEPTNIRLGEFLKRWLADRKPRVSPKTYQEDRWIAERHINPHFGNVLLDHLRPGHLQDHYSRALREGRLDGSGGLSPLPVLRQHRMIYATLQYAVKQGLVGRNVAQAVDPPRPARNEMRTLQPEEVRRLLEVVRDSWVYGPIFLAVYTGMRRSEILGLKWSDVDLEMATLSVRRAMHQLRDRSHVFTQPKSQKGKRQVALTPSTVSMLREYRANKDFEAVMLGTKLSDDRLVFTRADGSPLPADSLSLTYLRHVRSIGIWGVRFHDLRHTHASLMLRQGVHPKIVQERLGHSTVSITLDTYSHVTPGLQEAAAQRFEEGLTPVVPPVAPSEVGF